MKERISLTNEDIVNAIKKTMPRIKFKSPKRDPKANAYSRRVKHKKSYKEDV